MNATWRRVALWGALLAVLAAGLVYAFRPEPVPVDLASAVRGPLTVTVRRGDTLWAIGRRYNVSTGELMAMNGLTSSKIHPGDRITVRR